MAGQGDQGKVPQTSKRPYLLALAVMVSVGVAYLGYGFFSTKPETKKPAAAKNPLTVLPNDTVGWQEIMNSLSFKRQFRLKKTTDLLGLHLVYLESRRVPQQIIIAENVPQNSSAILFSANPDMALMTMISNQLLALKKKRNAKRLLVDKIDTVSTEPVLLNGRQFQHRQVKVTIRFESEKKTRYYVASLLKYSTPNNLASDNRQPLETVLVAFAKPESFDSEILPGLLALNPQFAAPQFGKFTLKNPSPNTPLGDTAKLKQAP
jgi:hypothetical protein